MHIFLIVGKCDLNQYYRRGEELFCGVLASGHRS